MSGPTASEFVTVMHEREAKHGLQQAFERFFAKQQGRWLSDRTYHHVAHELPRAHVERSTTDFTIASIDRDSKEKVLTAVNKELSPAAVECAVGFRVLFDTILEKEHVQGGCDALFVPTNFENSIVKGTYYRDQGFEEPTPKVSEFTFDPDKNELTMITTYQRVTSVDSVILLNDNTRIRKILNFALDRGGSDGPGGRGELSMAGFALEHRAGPEA
eukprot:tig00020830_g14502.t1